jgi:hypothetical protein
MGSKSAAAAKTPAAPAQMTAAQQAAAMFGHMDIEF